MVRAQLLVRDGRLLAGVVLRAQNVVHQPLVAGGGGEHAAHEMISAVRVRKGVQRVIRIHAELLRGDEHRAGGAQRDVAAAVAHHAGAHGRGGVVARAGADLHVLREAQQLRDLRPQRADRLIALVQRGHLCFRDAAQIKHFLRPALVRHIQQQHARGVGIVAAVHTGEDVVHIVLGEHDLRDPGEVLRLVFTHPEDLRRGEAGEGDVGRPRTQLLLADHIVQVVHLRGGAAVVPEDRRADDVVVPVQHHQAVHLAAGANAGDLALVAICRQLLQAGKHRVFPVLGRLLAPAGVRKLQRILPGHLLMDHAELVHQQQLDRRGTQINADIVHSFTPSVVGNGEKQNAMRPASRSPPKEDAPEKWSVACSAGLLPLLSVAIINQFYINVNKPYRGFVQTSSKYKNGGSGGRI